MDMYNKHAPFDFFPGAIFNFLSFSSTVIKGAKIRNRYNQVSHVSVSRILGLVAYGEERAMLQVSCQLFRIW